MTLFRCPKCGATAQNPTNLDEIRAEIEDLKAANHVFATSQGRYVVARNAAVDREMQLRIAGLALIKQITDHFVPKDWACRECMPTSTVLVDGFLCGLHRLRAILAIEEGA